ncbi:MAG TPA: sigma-70 family RNA polymerase sigma factor [Tepidisphaeraceae bacterium]|nr:sigma-70 family RNA polymerase sigma factor [Tepidisphaeraceae bacterium]
MSSVSGAHFGPDRVQPAHEPAPASDAELMQAARSGDRGAFGQIVTRYQDRLFTAVLRLVGDYEDARELTQEAFTRAMISLENFRGDAQPYTWLFRIAMNLSISRLRKASRKRVFSLDAPANGRRHGGSDDQAATLVDRVSNVRSEAPEAAAERREAQQQVLAALGRLDSEYRAILVMRDVEGFDYQQMADLLDLPLGTLKSRLFRARLALRDELKGYMQKG